MAGGQIDEWRAGHEAGGREDAANTRKGKLLMQSIGKEEGRQERSRSRGVNADRRKSEESEVESAKRADEQAPAEAER